MTVINGDDGVVRNIADTTRQAVDCAKRPITA